ncbi:MAG: phage tail tube protein [Candidatus Bathyarchaeota archaeon]|nr:phage tail tube protein [Candidatus Bathyarchaeota archaeon]
MSTPVYGAHETKAFYVVESTYGVTPADPSMTGLATAQTVEPSLNPGHIKVRGSGSRDLQAIRKGLRQVGLKIGYNLPAVSPIDFLLNVQTLDSLTMEVTYEKTGSIVDLVYTGCRFNTVTVECSVEDLLKATVDLIGQNVTVGTDKISGASYADHSGAVPYYESYVKQDTSALEHVTDFRFSIENNLKRVPVIRASDGDLLKYLPERHRNCSGEVTFEFETKDEFDDVINDAEFDLEFGLGSSNKAVFSDCKWDQISSPTRIEDLVSVKAPFVARSVAIS